MGFPVFRQLSCGVKLCSFADDYPEAQCSSDDVANESVELVSSRKSEMPSRTAASQLVGNAMHMECVGIFLLGILSQGGMEIGKIQRERFRKLPEDSEASSAHMSSTLRDLNRFLAGPPKGHSR